MVHLPVYDPEHPVFTYVAAVMLGHDLGAYEALAREGTAAAMAAIYRWFVDGRAGAGGVRRGACGWPREPTTCRCCSTAAPARTAPAGWR